MSEKTHQSDADVAKFYDSTHLAWKRANGYSELEVSQKRQSLEQVMIVDSEEIHNQRFSDAGFAHSQTWFRCMNWASFLVEPE